MCKLPGFGAFTPLPDTFQIQIGQPLPFVTVTYSIDCN